MTTANTIPGRCRGVHVVHLPASTTTVVTTLLTVLSYIPTLQPICNICSQHLTLTHTLLLNKQYYYLR